MEEVISSVLPFHKVEHVENTTSTSDESNEAHNGKFNTWDVVYLVASAIIIIFGSIGNLLTFIVMQRGSMKDVSTCLYMSILALADTGE